MMMGISLGGPERSTVAITARSGAEFKASQHVESERSERLRERADSRSHEFEELAQRLCKDLANRSTRLSFFLHASSERVGVRVVDSSTSEVLRELPPEQQLELMARIKDMVGVILDQQM